MSTWVGIKNKTRKDLKSQPYLHAYYKVEAIFDKTNLLNRNGNLLTRFNSALVEKLNDTKCSKLPRYILILLDKDMINFTNYANFGVKSMFKQFCTWLQSNTTVHIETWKEYIRSKKPGVLTSSAEPRFIWIAALNRPPNSLNKETFRLISKFNDVVDEIVASTGHAHFLQITSVNDFSHFDQGGRLTVMGKEQFWRELDATFKEFDRGTEELLSP